MKTPAVDDELVCRGARVIGGIGSANSRLRDALRICVRAVCIAVLALMPNLQALAGEKIVFCLENADVRPWRTQEGGGLNIALLNQVAKQLSVTFEYQGMPWKRCLAQLKANEVSGAVGGSYKAERLEIGAYPGGSKPDASKRLNFDRYILMRRKGSPVQWDGKGFHGLDGSVGIQIGYSVGETLRGIGVVVDESSQRARDLALKLIAGRLGAAAMLDGEAGTLMINEPKLAAQLEILPIPLVEKPYFVLLSHALVKSRPELAARIWNAVEEVRNSSAYQKLERDAVTGASH